jgi:hypothetical protein
MRTLAIVSAAVGGAALIGTVVYYFVDSSKSASHDTAGKQDRPRARLIPIVAPGIAGLGVSGAF